MRDFRDAKVMARALRDALKSTAIETTHAEALELIAKAFGYNVGRVRRRCGNSVMKLRRLALSLHRIASGANVATPYTVPHSKFEIGTCLLEAA
jgi:hypothetical protein